MKKEILIILCIIMTIYIIIFLYFNILKKDKINNEEKNSIMTENILDDCSENIEIAMKAVIVKIYENQLLVRNCKNSSELIYINYSNEDNLEFEENQEIIVYYDGTINMINSEEISNVKKIEIIKENDSDAVSDVEDDIDININKFSVDEIIFSVTDMNDVPYKYLTNYEIYQEIKNEDSEEQFKEATDTSTSSYIRLKLFV